MGRCTGATSGTLARATRWWARLAGAGRRPGRPRNRRACGLDSRARWLPSTAVGELIINLLPASLVNFGKEALGLADKPVLLAMIVAGVLVICAVAGELELRRRFAGAALFAVVAVLGLIGVGT